MHRVLSINFFGISIILTICVLNKDYLAFILEKITMNVLTGDYRSYWKKKGGGDV